VGWKLKSVGAQFPGEARVILLNSSQTDSGAQPLPYQWVQVAVSVRVKWLGREAGHLPSPNAKVKNSGVLPLLRSATWCGAQRTVHRGTILPLHLPLTV
jgi:hypothetical protein